ncbi:MAG: hypothetical protein V8T36_07100 [Ruthenibacterium lactatiformans]
MAQNDFENKRDSADQKIDLRLWKRLIAYAMRHRRTVVSVMLVLLVVAGIDLAYPQLSRYAIDHFIEGGTTEGLWLYGLVYAALVVVQSLGVFLSCARRGPAGNGHELRHPAGCVCKAPAAFVQLLRHHLRWLADGPHGE